MKRLLKYAIPVIGIGVSYALGKHSHGPIPLYAAAFSILVFGGAIIAMLRSENGA